MRTDAVIECLNDRRPQIKAASNNGATSCKTMSPAIAFIALNSFVLLDLPQRRRDDVK